MAVDLAAERIVLHAGAGQVVTDGVIVDRAHQHIKASLHGDLGAGQALFLRQRNHFQVGALAMGLHGLDQVHHLIQRQAHVLEAPLLHRQVGSGQEVRLRGGNGLVVVGKHYNQFLIHVSQFPSVCFI